jgi:hypothetical protein
VHKLDKFAGYRGVHRFKEFRRRYLNNVDDLGELSLTKHKRQDVEWPKIRHGNVGKLFKVAFRGYPWMAATCLGRRIGE